MKIGYARVSRDEQNLDRQLAALEKEECEKIFTDKISGLSKSRTELDKMLGILVPGDTLIVQKLDRLGRNVINLLQLIEDFNERGIKFKSIDDGFDTTTSVGLFIMTVLGAFARLERDVIRERTKDALQTAKRKGKRLGPPLKDFSEEIEIMKTLTGTPDEIATQMGISRAKYYRLIKINRLQTDN